MKPSKSLDRIPGQRISPFDGMAVTADIWQSEQSYHRLSLESHRQLEHGAGILLGLDVHASQPPGSVVTVEPGAAADPLGRLIVVREPVNVDLGNASGLVHLTIRYTERPIAPENPLGSAAQYVRSEFALETVRGTFPPDALELARVRCGGAAQPITDPRRAISPTVNEIDQRHRHELHTTVVCPVEMATTIRTADRAVNERHSLGVHNLARALERSGIRLCVGAMDDLDHSAAQHDLIYAVVDRSVAFRDDEIRTLTALLKRGGTLLIELCRPGRGLPDPRANAALEISGKLGVSPTPVEPGHAVLSDPYVFAQPPRGAHRVEGPRLFSDGGVLISRCDWGSLWAGRLENGPAERHQIRSAIEWGANLVTYAAHRHEQAQKSQEPTDTRGPADSYRCADCPEFV